MPGGGLAKRCSKGHKLISSIQMSETFCPHSLIGRGGGGRDVLERLTTTGGAPPPPPLE